MDEHRAVPPETAAHCTISRDHDIEQIVKVVCRQQSVILGRYHSHFKKMPSNPLASLDWSKLVKSKALQYENFYERGMFQRKRQQTLNKMKLQIVKDNLSQYNSISMYMIMVVTCLYLILVLLCVEAMFANITTLIWISACKVFDNQSTVTAGIVDNHILPRCNYLSVTRVG